MGDGGLLVASNQRVWVHHLRQDLLADVSAPRHLVDGAPAVAAAARGHRGAPHPAASRSGARRLAAPRDGTAAGSAERFVQRQASCLAFGSCKEGRGVGGVLTCTWWWG